MENGARGATLNALEMRSYSNLEGQAMESRSRQLCDIITSSEIEGKVLENLEQSGLFNGEKLCVVQTLDAEIPPTFLQGHSS